MKIQTLSGYIVDVKKEPAKEPVKDVGAKDDSKPRIKDKPGEIRAKRNDPLNVSLIDMRATEAMQRARRDRGWLLDESPKTVKRFREVAKSIRIRGEDWVWMGPTNRMGNPYGKIKKDHNSAIRHFLLQVYTGFASKGTRLTKVTCGNMRCLRPTHYDVSSRVFDLYDMEDFDAVILRALRACPEGREAVEKALRL